MEICGKFKGDRKQKFTPRAWITKGVEHAYLTT